VNPLPRLRTWAAAHPASAAGSLALLGLSAGCGLVYAPLALIVPSVYVLSAVTWSHLRGE
jgi:hypothetical protein